MFYTSQDILHTFFERSVTPKVRVVVNIGSFMATINTVDPEKFIAPLQQLNFVSKVAKNRDGLTVFFHQGFCYSEKFDADFRGAVLYLDNYPKLR